jgi:hypothetical protein
MTMRPCGAAAMTGLALGCAPWRSHFIALRHNRNALTRLPSAMLEFPHI